MARKTKNQQMLDEMIGNNVGDNVEDNIENKPAYVVTPSGSGVGLTEVLNPTYLTIAHPGHDKIPNVVIVGKSAIEIEEKNKIKNELTTPVEIEIYNETDEKIPAGIVVQTSWGKPTHYARRNVQTLDYTTENPNPPEGYINYNRGVYKARPDKPFKN